MSALFFALAAEAKPWIQALNAKPDREQGHFRFYHTLEREHSIAITGPGKVAMAMAVTEFAQKIHKSKRKDHFRIWNIGIAGAPNIDYPIGDFFWINKVTDISSGRDYYTERIEKVSNHKELSISTFDKPVTIISPSPSPFFQSVGRESLHSTSLIDMEASGFFEAASVYFDLSTIQIGKIVSDHLEGYMCDPNLVQGYINRTCIELKDIFLSETVFPKREILSMQDWAGFKKVGENLHFTESMLVELKKSILYYKINHPDKQVPVPNLSDEEKPNEKYQSKKIFSDWRNSLYV
ncbi:MAG: phosphorylase [Leptospira sp.]|nr:phosphorylase [Leptospira sp.]